MKSKIDSYVEEQAQNGVSSQLVRYNLLKAGWSSQEIHKAIWKYYSADRKTSHSGNKHLLRGLIVLVGVLMGVILVIYLAVINIDKGIIPSDPVDPIEPLDPIIPVEPVAKDCPDITNSVQKDSCYRNKVANGFDCETLTDTVEQNFCFRAVDAYLRAE